MSNTLKSSNTQRYDLLVQCIRSGQVGIKEMQKLFKDKVFVEYYKHIGRT